MNKILLCVLAAALVGAGMPNLEIRGDNCYRMSGTVRGCGINRNVLMFCGISFPMVLEFQLCTMRARYTNYSTCEPGHSSGYWGEGSSYLFFCSFTARATGTCCGGAVTSMTAFDSYSTTNCEFGGCGSGSTGG